MRNRVRCRISWRVALPALVALAVAFGAERATAQAEVPSSRGCEAWPGSLYDSVTGSCRCPQGQWWNMRGDACRLREEVADEVCARVWSGSKATWLEDGSYRCVCPSLLVWDAATQGCRAPARRGDTICSSRWPGTVPVLSPSGEDFECRCPGGWRWESPKLACVPDAPAASTGPSVAPPATAPRPEFSQPQTTIPAEPRSEPDAARTPPAPVPPPHVAEPPLLPPPAASPPPPPPAAGPPTWQRERVPERREAEPAPPPAAVSPRPLRVPGTDAPASAPAPPRVPEVYDPTSSCDGALAEIARRVAEGASRDEIDGLAIRAAVRGCDPNDIAEAAKAPPPYNR